MGKYVCNRVSMTNYTNGTIRLDGSVLDGLDVLAWTNHLGQRLIWMNECGRLRRSRVAGFILVRWSDLAKKHMPTARRALLTNSNDLGAALALWPDRLEAPEIVRLGIRKQGNYIEDSEDVGLPPWARGYEVIEAEEPIGCFAALGYCLSGQEARFKAAKRYYCELLIEDRDGFDKKN